MKTFNQHIFSCFLVFNFVVSPLQAIGDGAAAAATISFATLGRASYAFDIYALPATGSPKEIRLTDGESVNFNGYFPSSSSFSMLPLLPNQSAPKTHIIYVTERNGSSKIYLDALYGASVLRSGSRSILEDQNESTRLQVLLVGDEQTNGRVSMKDKPSLVGQSLIYVSTHEDPGETRASWTAVYSTHLATGSTRRLTPKGSLISAPPCRRRGYGRR